MLLQCGGSRKPWRHVLARLEVPNLAEIPNCPEVLPMYRQTQLTPPIDIRLTPKRTASGKIVPWTIYGGEAAIALANQSSRWLVHCAAYDPYESSLKTMRINDLKAQAVGDAETSHIFKEMKCNSIAI